MGSMVRIRLVATPASSPGFGVSGRVICCDSSSGFSKDEAVIGVGTGQVDPILTLPRASLVRSPKLLTLYEAAVLPTTVPQAVCGLAGLECGQTVLIRGADSPVGTVAIQIAKSRGCRVLATGNARRVPMLWDLGADLALAEGTVVSESVHRVFDAGNLPTVHADRMELKTATTLAEQAGLVPFVDRICPPDTLTAGLDHVVWQIGRLDRARG